MRTIQEKWEKVQDFRPIDDVFFEALAQSKEVCQEILRVIMEDKKLIVSTIGEIKSKNEFYDYESKYILDSNLIIPANLDQKLIKQIQEYSIKIFKILSLSEITKPEYPFKSIVDFWLPFATPLIFTTPSISPILP